MNKVITSITIENTIEYNNADALSILFTLFFSASAYTQGNTYTVNYSTANGMLARTYRQDGHWSGSMV